MIWPVWSFQKVMDARRGGQLYAWHHVTAIGLWEMVFIANNIWAECPVAVFFFMIKYSSFFFIAAPFANGIFYIVNFKLVQSCVWIKGPKVQSNSCASTLESFIQLEKLMILFNEYE